MSAPSETRKRQRSWTCGSHAALPITVSPSARTAAMTAFSVAITLGSSRKTCLPRRPLRPHLVAAVQGDLDAELGEARGCAGRACAGRSRRRPAAARSPCRSARAAARRAGTKPGSAGRAPRRAPTCARTTNRREPRSRRVHSTSAPMSSRSSSIVVTSRIRGTFVSRTGSLASTQAARIGQDAVLVPGRPDAAAERLAALDHEGLEVLLGREGQRHRQGHAGQAGTRRRPVELTRDRPGRR